VPLPDPQEPGGSAGPEQPRSLPPECAGTYANGDAEYVVTGPDGPAGEHYAVAFGGSDLGLLASGSDLAFGLLDDSSGQRVPGGRFLRDPVTGRITGMQVSGRVARRVEAGEP
jgi:hypothetical protein